MAAEELEKQLGYSSSRSGETPVTLKMVDGELSREVEIQVGKRGFQGKPRY